MISSYKFRLHLIVFLWGFTAILGKMITVPADSLVFFRMLLASVCLFFYIKFYEKKSLQIDKKNLGKLVLIGAFMAAHWYCFFASIKSSNVAIAVSCLSLSTIFASLLEPLVYRRKIRIYEVLLGMIILVCISVIFRVETRFATGIIYGIICAFCGTVFSVFNGKLSEKVEAESVIFYEILSGTALLGIVYILMGNFSAFAIPDVANSAWLLLLAAVFTAYPMLESVKLMKHISPFTLILTVNLEPIYGIIFATMIFGKSEEMSLAFYISAVVMIGAIAVNGIIKSREKVVE